MSYFHKSEHCISPAINPPADCRNQADGAEPRQNEAVVGHPALLDILKTLEQKSSTGSASVCSGWGEGSNEQLETPGARSSKKQGLKRGGGGDKRWCGAIPDSGTVIIEAKNASSLPQVGKSALVGNWREKRQSQGRIMLRDSMRPCPLQTACA